MAWIKVNVALDSKPQTVRMARILKINPAYVIGLLVKFWSRMDALTDNGRLEFCGPEEVDNIVGHKGFGKALEAVKWIAYDDEGATIPEYDKHNGNSAKKRADAQERKRRSRKNQTEAGQKSQDGHADVTENRDKNVTHKRRGDKRRTTTDVVVVTDDHDDPPISPSMEEVLTASEALGMSRTEAEKFYLYNASRGWKTIADWRSALALWNRREAERVEANLSFPEKNPARPAVKLNMGVDLD